MEHQAAELKQLVADRQQQIDELQASNVPAIADFT